MENTNIVNQGSEQNPEATNPAENETGVNTQPGIKETELKAEDANKEQLEGIPGMLGGAQEEEKEKDASVEGGMLEGAGEKETSDADKSTDKKEGKEDEQPEETKIPEAYELKFPEGFALDKETLEAVTPTLKELGATNEQVQQLSDEVCKLITKNNNANREALRRQTEMFEKELRADEEIGGAKFEQSRNLAAQAVKKLLGNEEAADLIKMLDETGLSSYPAFFKLLRNMGERLSEDGFVKSNGEGGERTEDERAKVHWPSSY